MRFGLVIQLLPILLTIAGCAIWGPSYSKPNTANPDNWYSRDYLAKTESVNLPYLAWWKKFKDPQLNNLIESALKNNNNIQVAIGNIIAAQGQLQQIQMGWVPTIGAIIGGNKNSFSNQGVTSSGAATTSSTGTSAASGAAILGNNYQMGLVPSYTLNILQQIRSQQFAGANLQAQRAAKDSMRLAIISQVVGSYFTLLGQDYQLKLQQKLTKDMLELLTLAKAEFKDGLISLYTLQQYEQQYQQAKAQVPIIQNNVVASRNALRLLLNQNPGEIKRGLAFMQLNSEKIIPANLPSTVLRNRPDVRMAEQQLIAANANIGVATTTFFPSIVLTSPAGMIAPQLLNLFNNASDYWSTTLAATLPLLSLSTFGQIKSAKGAYYSAYYNYIQTVRGAFASVDNDLSAHDKLTKSMLDQIAYYKSSKLAYELATASFLDGLYSKPQLLQNAVNLDIAKITVEQSKLAQLQTIVQLYQDLGGGYQYQNYESANQFGDSHDS